MDYVEAAVKCAFLLVTYPFRHPKLLLVGVIIVFAFIGIHACSVLTRPKTSTGQPVPAYALNVPPISEAPYMVQTQTRIYFVQSYSGTPTTTLTLNRFYSWDGKTWRLQTVPLTLVPKFIGPLRLYTR